MGKSKWDDDSLESTPTVTPTVKSSKWDDEEMSPSLAVRYQNALLDPNKTPILGKPARAVHKAGEWMGEKIKNNQPAIAAGLATMAMPASWPWWLMGLGAGTTAGGVSYLQGDKPSEVAGEALSSGVAGAAAPAVSKYVVKPAAKAVAPYVQAALAKTLPKIAEPLFGTADPHAFRIAMQAMDKKMANQLSPELTGLGAQLTSKEASGIVPEAFNPFAMKLLNMTPKKFSGLNIAAEMQAIANNLPRNAAGELTPEMAELSSKIATLIGNKWGNVLNAQSPMLPFNAYGGRLGNAAAQFGGNEMTQALWEQLMKHGKETVSDVKEKFNKGGQ